MQLVLFVLARRDEQNGRVSLLACRAARAKPSVPGSMISSSSRSNRRVSIKCSAVSPSGAGTTLKSPPLFAVK